jgi:predicted HTH domain antitoxin
VKFQIEIDLPDDSFDPVLQDDLAAACKQEVVLRLFADRKLPAAVATRILGLTRLQFMELARSRGIPYAVYTASDFRDDLQDLDAFEHKSGDPR